MFRIMCKSKIQRAKVTKTDLHYSGSIGIDKKILEAGNIYPNEIVQVLNADTGARFETYAIEEKADSGNVVLYGPAARLGQVGDKIIIISKVLAEAKEIQNLKTKIVKLDDKNRIIKK